MAFDDLKEQFVGQLHEIVRKQLLEGISSEKVSQQTSAFVESKSIHNSNNSSDKQKIHELSNVVKGLPGVVNKVQ